MPDQPTHKTNSPSYDEINSFSNQRPPKSIENIHESYYSFDLGDTKSRANAPTSTTSRVLYRDDIEDETQPVIGLERKPGPISTDSKEFVIDERFGILNNHPRTILEKFLPAFPEIFQAIPVTPEN